MFGTLDQTAPVSLSDNVDPLYANNDAQIATLARALRMQRGFGLYFVSVNQAEQRRQVLTDLAERLPDVTLHEAFLREPIVGLLRHLQTMFPNLPATLENPPLLCVYGMENWLGGGEAVQDSEFVADLNATRNAFSAALNCPVLFIVPEHILVGIQRGAPDFFSVRSGVYFLDTPPEARLLPTFDVMQSAELSTAMGVGIAGRQRQAAEWEEILNGFRALPAERRDPLAELRASQNLATTRYAQGEYRLALPLLERALAISECALGLDHAATATSLNNLASLYESQGDYAKARPLFNRALAINEHTFGPDHPETATSLNNLAALYESQGDYTKALPLFEHALAIREMMLGPDHPNTATSLNNLASLYECQGDYAKALPLVERALAIHERALGLDHAVTATSLNNLASLHESQGNYAKALPLFNRALSINEHTFGPDHPETATSLNNLAHLYESQGDYTKALPLFEHALAIREKMLGPDHPNTATSLNNLAYLYASQGDYAKALPIFERALAISESGLGRDHPIDFL